MADVVNIAVVVAFDALLLYFWGFKALMYLLTGNIFGGGLHPMAGHLIAEHYTFIKVFASAISSIEFCKCGTCFDNHCQDQAAP